MPVSTSATVTKASSHELDTTVSEQASVVVSRFRLLSVGKQVGATISKTVFSNRITNSATSVVFIKIPQKIFLLTLSQVASISRGKVFAIILATSAKAGHTVVNQLLTATQATAATLTFTKISNKTLSTTQAQSPQVIKTTNKTLTTGFQISLPPVFFGVSQVASLSALFFKGKTFSATQGQSTTVNRIISVTKITNPVVSVPTVIRSVVKNLGTTVGQSATVTKIKGLLATAAAVSVATVQNMLATTKSASSNPVATVNKVPQRSFSAVSGQLASLTRLKVATVATKITSVSTGATLVKNLFTTLIAGQDQTVKISKIPSKIFDITTVSSAANLSKTAMKNLSSVIVTKTTVARGFFSNQFPTAHPVVVLKRFVARILKTSSRPVSTITHTIIRLSGLAGSITLRIIEAAPMLLRMINAIQIKLRNLLH